MPRPWVVEDSRSWLNSSKRETPRDEPVASGIWVGFVLAANVRLHGTSPWHLYPRLKSDNCHDGPRQMPFAIGIQKVAVNPEFRDVCTMRNNEGR
jgi:hypothetical protein